MGGPHDTSLGPCPGHGELGAHNGEKPSPTRANFSLFPLPSPHTLLFTTPERGWTCWAGRGGFNSSLSLDVWLLPWITHIETLWWHLRAHSEVSAPSCLCQTKAKRGIKRKIPFLKETEHPGVVAAGLCLQVTLSCLYQLLCNLVLPSEPDGIMDFFKLIMRKRRFTPRRRNIVFAFYSCICHCNPRSRCAVGGDK